MIVLAWLMSIWDFLTQPWVLVGWTVLGLVTGIVVGRMPRIADEKERDQE